MPPAWIRRPIAISLWAAIAAAYLLTSPLSVAATALLALATGDRRALRMALGLRAYFRCELAALTACGGLWVLACGGLLMRTAPLQRAHWGLLRWFARSAARSALEIFEVDVEVDDPPEAVAAFRRDDPLLVLSRHAGPGDTILLIDALLSRHRRHPSVVLKETVAIDPTIDLLAHRLPHAVLDLDDAAGCEEQIRRVAAELGPRGALLIFPEGGNFTAERRRRALAHLRRRGERSAAARARRMRHVLPPRPSGMLAVLEANADADVVFAAHTGLGLASYPSELWRDMPVGRTLRTRTWFVDRSDVPTGREDRVAWLNGWWERIDAWIDAQGTEPVIGGTIPEGS